MKELAITLKNISLLLVGIVIMAVIIDSVELAIHFPDSVQKLLIFSWLSFITFKNIHEIIKINE